MPVPTRDGARPRSRNRPSHVRSTMLKSGCGLSNGPPEPHNGLTLNGRPGADHAFELRGTFRRAGPFQRRVIPRSLPLRAVRHVDLAGVFSGIEPSAEL